MEQIGLDEIRSLLPRLDSDRFSPDVFRAAGVFVVRNAIPAPTIQDWQNAWENFKATDMSAGRKVNKYNPVAVEEPLPPVLAAIRQHPALLDIVESVFGPDIALFNQRLVVKDCHSRGPVFLHHDSPYHFGWPTKASAFVPLSDVTPENGGLVFYLGTHHFGYLGDAGEINPDLLPADWPTICPQLMAGDVVLMHSSTWHRSGPHVSGPDRVIVDIIYQPANDASGIALLRGQWRTTLFLPERANDRLFKRSRSSMMKNMQTQLDQLAEGHSGKA